MGTTDGKEAQVALGKLLKKLNLIPGDQAEHLPAESEFCPIALFARQGLLDEDDAIELVAQRLQIPSVQFEKQNNDRLSLLLDHHKVSNVALEQWRDMRATPVEIEDYRVTIAMANPLDLAVPERLKFDLGCEIKVAIAREDEILALLARKLNSARMVDLHTLLEKSTPAEVTTTVGNSSDIGQSQESNVTGDDPTAAPVVRLANKILSDAIQLNASDIHLNPERDELRVKLRIDGMMQSLFSVPRAVKNGVTSRLKLLAGMDIAEKRKPQDGRLRIKSNYGIKDLRLSTVPTVYGENLVIRILSSDISKLSFEYLGLPEHLIPHLKGALLGSSHMVLSTGPTGSGKSSTLYACLLHLRDGTSNIITIEDPIEYRIQGVNQIQVNSKIGVTFAEGLRSILRQDPDVIMVGEIRDHDTASISLQAAQTGHLVLSSLHTHSAPAAITRIRDLGIPAYVIASSLGAVVAQRLVRCLCPACSVPLKGIDLSSYVPLGIHPDKMKGAVGCTECSGIGFKGRTGIFSLLVVCEGVREAIRGEASEREIEQYARESGYCTLVEASIALLNSGITSIDEVERALGALDAQRPPLENGAPVSSSKLGKGSPLDRRRILLVEDDEGTRSVISLLLMREMYEVIEAKDGVEALEKIYENPPELIVCDLMMPRMNGLEFLRKIRRDPRIKSLPVIMLTAADTEQNEVKLIEDGADDFVSKTADSKIMLSRIQRLLERVAS